jgi:hypothetical protein
MEPVFFEGLHEVAPGGWKWPSQNKLPQMVALGGFLQVSGLRRHSYLGTSILCGQPNRDLAKAFWKGPGYRLGQAGCRKRKVSFLTLLSSSAPTYPSVPCPLCEGSSLAKLQLLLALAIPLKKHTLAGRGDARL